MEIGEFLSNTLRINAEPKQLDKVKESMSHELLEAFSFLNSTHACIVSLRVVDYISYSCMY